MKKILLAFYCLGFGVTVYGEQPIPPLNLPNPFAGVTSLRVDSHIDVETFAPELPPKAKISSSFQTAGERFKLVLKSRLPTGELIADNLIGYDEDHYYLITCLDGVAELQKQPVMNKPISAGALGALEAFEFLLPFSSKFQARKDEAVQMVFQTADIASMWAGWLKNVKVLSIKNNNTFTEYELMSPGINPLTFEPAYYKIQLRTSGNSIGLMQVELHNKKDDSVFSVLKVPALQEVYKNGLELPHTIDSTYYLDGKVFCHQVTTLDSCEINSVNPESFLFDPAESNLRSIRDNDSKTTVQVPR